MTAIAYLRGRTPPKAGRVPRELVRAGAVLRIADVEIGAWKAIKARVEGLMLERDGSVQIALLNARLVVLAGDADKAIGAWEEIQGELLAAGAQREK